MKKPNSHNYCLNCGATFHSITEEKKDTYCHDCGQSSKESKLSIFRLMSDAISNIFNLDSRLVHTFRDLFFPARLTQAYTEGRRKYYVNPARLFIFLLIVLITLSIYAINFRDIDFGVDELYGKAERSAMLDDYDGFIDSLAIDKDPILVDTIRQKLFSDVNSMKNDTIGKNRDIKIGIGKGITEFGISTYDALHLSSKEIYKKYNVTATVDKITVSQYIKMVTNPADALMFMLKNATWALFLTVIIMSLFMKLLYWRMRAYIVEHAVLLLYSHSFLFFLMIINIIILLITKNNDSNDIIPIISTVSWVTIFIVQFLSLKKYFKQGIFKTLIKQFLINSVYIFILMFTTLGVGVISVFLY